MYIEGDAQSQMSLVGNGEKRICAIYAAGDAQ